MGSIKQKSSFEQALQIQIILHMLSVHSVVSNGYDNKQLILTTDKALFFIRKI